MPSKRLAPGDRDLARKLFATMAEIFEEDCETLADEYLDRLLAREDFWAIAAFDGEEIIGGVTAHALPMTRTASREIFLYDIAVRAEHRRKGVGRHLLTEVRESAAAQGIEVMFVAVDNADLDALEFYRAAGGTPSPVTVFTFTHPEK